MINTLKPEVGQWYAHLDKGQRFFVTAISDDGDAIEIQHFDGDIDELSREEWTQMQIEESVQPENWAGAMDISNRDDLGTDITDTAGTDWTEPQKDFRQPNN